MLFSEKNRMKVHKNQWLLTMLYPLVRLAGATRRGQTMAPEGQKPSKWLCLPKLPREMYPQPIVHKALSWGAIRKPACILAEITIRKSQISTAKLCYQSRFLPSPPSSDNRSLPALQFPSLRGGTSSPKKAKWRFCSMTNMYHLTRRDRFSIRSQTKGLGSYLKVHPVGLLLSMPSSSLSY
jgi:hypothetical protein